MRSIIYFSIIAMAVILLSCGGKKPAPESVAAPNESNTIVLTNAQIKNAGIAIGKIQQKDISSILKLNGQIDVPPQNMVSVSVPLGGYLKSTRLLPGMHVSKGEVIAIIEDQQYIQLQQDYLAAKAKISYLENEYKRQKDLNESKASSDKVYQQAESDYHGQKVLITALAEKLKLIGINPNNISESRILRSVNVYSPISGFVSKVDVNIGKYISPTEVLFELVDPSDIHLALKVFEKDINKLFIGQPFIAYTNNEPDKKHSGKIILIGRDLSADRTADVHCHFDTYDKTLVPGTYMNAEIRIKTIKALTLPTESIVTYANKQFVYVANGSRFEMIEVKTGESENGLISVELPEKYNALNLDFVTKGAYAILMMMKNTSE